MTALTIDQASGFTSTVKRIRLKRNTDSMQDFECKLLVGNAEDMLANKDIRTDYYKSIQCVITSPPYFPQQRSYGVLKSDELGQEENAETYIQNLGYVFAAIRPLLKDNASIFIVIDDGVQDGVKLNIPFRLVENLKEHGYYYRDSIVWIKANPPQGRLSGRLYPVFEYILHLSSGKEKPFFETDRLRQKRLVNDPILTNAIYTYHAEKDEKHAENDTFEKTSYVNLIDYESLLEGVFVNRRDMSIRYKINFEDFQVNPIARNAYLIEKYERIIRQQDIKNFPSTSEIAAAFGFDPEKHCPICYEKYKRHASRTKAFRTSVKSSIFAVCQSKGKAFTNVWKIASGIIVKDRYHEATFPYSLVYRLIKMASNADDMILDPFCGRGTTGMIAYSMNRNFFGVDLYKKNIENTWTNLEDIKNKKLEIDFYDHQIA